MPLIVLFFLQWSALTVHLKSKRGPLMRLGYALFWPWRLTDSYRSSKMHSLTAVRNNSQDAFICQWKNLDRNQKDCLGRSEPSSSFRKDGWISEPIKTKEPKLWSNILGSRKSSASNFQTFLFPNISSLSVETFCKFTGEVWYKQREHLRKCSNSKHLSQTRAFEGSLNLYRAATVSEGANWSFGIKVKPG